MYKVRPNERIDFHFTGAKNKSIVVEPTDHSVIKTNTTNPRQMQKTTQLNATQSMDKPNHCGILTSLVQTTNRK